MGPSIAGPSTVNGLGTNLFGCTTEQSLSVLVDHPDRGRRRAVSVADRMPHPELPRLDPNVQDRTLMFLLHRLCPANSRKIQIHPTSRPNRALPAHRLGRHSKALYAGRRWARGLTCNNSDMGVAVKTSSRPPSPQLKKLDASHAVPRFHPRSHDMSRWWPLQWPSGPAARGYPTAKSWRIFTLLT